MGEEYYNIEKLERKTWKTFEALGKRISELEKRFNYLHKKLNANFTDGFSLGFKMGSKTDLTIELREQINKLAKYILEYFPGKIIDEGACLTAIGIMEELRTS